MKINGIIAEYNPFHNGHQYHLEESRRLTGSDYTVVVMSGDFVQRGMPALVDKHVRTRMALLGGADLVLELPVLYATASSEAFAAGAVTLLDKLGVITHLCFGSECGNAMLLEQIAAFLSREPEEYRASLKSFLKQGLSFPDARAKALASQAESEKCDKLSSSRSPLPDHCEELLSSPNNILGIDYIKEIIRRKSSIIPVTVKRIGAGYHELLTSESLKYAEQTSPRLTDSGNFPTDDLLSGTSTADTGIPAPLSALAIRQAIYDGQTPERFRPFIPEEPFMLLKTCLAQKTPLSPDAFSGILYYKLLLEQHLGYEKYLDVSKDLSNRIRNNLSQFTGFGSFCDLLKTKEVTHTRISRCLLHILLNIKQEDMQMGKELDYIPYARVLGFRRSSEALFGELKEHCSVPLITKLADAQKSLPEDAGRLLKMDILASEIYQGIVYGGTRRTAPNEISTPLVIL